MFRWVTFARTLCAVAATLIFAASEARAELIFGAQVVSTGSGPYIGFDNDFIAMTYGTDTIGPATIDIASEYGSAQASAWVDQGALRATASASGYDFVTAPFLQPGSASAGAMFVDTFVARSSTLPDGSLVDADFDWVLTYSATGTGCTERSDVYAYLSLSGFYVNGQSAGGAVRQKLDSTCDPDFELDNSTFQVRIGEEIRTEAFLLVTAQGVAWTTTDAANTLRLAVRPLGDFTFETASGNDYTPASTSVPEPGGLTALALLGLCYWVRRRR